MGVKEDCQENLQDALKDFLAEPHGQNWKDMCAAMFAYQQAREKKCTDDISSGRWIAKMYAEYFDTEYPS